jgi:hypothetical protein
MNIASYTKFLTAVGLVKSDFLYCIEICNETNKFLIKPITEHCSHVISTPDLY